MDLNNMGAFKKCWICESAKPLKIREANVQRPLSSEDFAITNKQYGITGEIYRCLKCNFMQCDNLNNVLPYYEELKDVEYENTRESRSLQERKLLELVEKFRGGGRLLDIGAGTGILIEEAIKMGYEAVGVEPAKWLQQQAVARGLPIINGTFPHSEIVGEFDVITLIDVIEHVSDPVELLSNVRRFLKDNGVGVVVVPDVNSFVAKICGWKWWHFRVAHIGYFNKENLLLALEKAGFRLIYMGRPNWYFTVGYILERIFNYMPKFIRIPRLKSKRFSNLIIPLNLHDSLVIVFNKKIIDMLKSKKSCINWLGVNAVILDVDGTLYDQAALRRKMLGELFGYYFKRPLRIKELKVLWDFRMAREQHRVDEAGDLNSRQYLWTAKKTGVSEMRVKELVKEWIFSRPLKHLKRCRFPGLLGFLGLLENRGVAYAFLSDYPAGEKLEALEIPKRRALAATDREIDRFKPHPRGLLKISEQLRVPPENCLMIGDRLGRDGEAARRAGMQFLLIKRNKNFYLTLKEDLLNGIFEKN